MTAPSDADVFRNAFEEAFRDAIQTFRLDVQVTIGHGRAIFIRAMNGGIGVSATWMTERDAVVICEISVPGTGFSLAPKKFILTDLPMIGEGSLTQWDGPPYQVQDAAARLLELGRAYQPATHRALAGDKEILAILHKRSSR